MSDALPPRRLLVVDDEPDTADVLAQLLQLLLPGWSVGVAYDGQTALEQAQRDWPDAVVLDIEMPVLDGVGAAMALRADAHGTAPVLVAVSGSILKADAARARGVFDHVMLKPVDAAALGRLLEAG